MYNERIFLNRQVDMPLKLINQLSVIIYVYFLFF